MPVCSATSPIARLVDISERGFDAPSRAPSVTCRDTAAHASRVNRLRARVRTPLVRRILLTGATGYVGGSLLPILLENGHAVRALARDAGRARTRLPDEVGIAEGDVVSGDGL